MGGSVVAGAEGDGAACWITVGGGMRAGIGIGIRVGLGAEAGWVLVEAASPFARVEALWLGPS